MDHIRRSFIYDLRFHWWRGITIFAGHKIAVVTIYDVLLQLLRRAHSTYTRQTFSYSLVSTVAGVEEDRVYRGHKSLLETFLTGFSILASSPPQHSLSIKRWMFYATTFRRFCFLLQYIRFRLLNPMTALSIFNEGQIIYKNYLF